jgi:cation diffusion facilitator CzcD-associated flavoprotein CzcO
MDKTGSDSPRRAVVVGGGPSGFYAADQLLAAGFEVDLLDALPTPFGLVRSGVAPDHPKIKTVTKAFTRIATPRVVVIGNGNVAIDVARMLVTDPGELDRPTTDMQPLHPYSTQERPNRGEKMMTAEHTIIDPRSD